MDVRLRPHPATCICCSQCKRQKHQIRSEGVGMELQIVSTEYVHVPNYMMMYMYICSLIPRPSSSSIFGCLPYAKTKEEGLGDLCHMHSTIM